MQLLMVRGGTAAGGALQRTHLLLGVAPVCPRQEPCEQLV